MEAPIAKEKLNLRSSANAYGEITQLCSQLGLRRS
jgi:hypothetical protein